MITHEAFVYELDPTPEQETLFWRHCGLSRYASNWALAIWNAHWDANRERPKAEREKRPSAYDLSKRWTATKQERLGEDGTPWTNELIRNVVTFAIAAVDNGFKHYFRRVKQKTPPYGYPRFKKRGKARDSFTIQDQSFRAEARAIHLGKIGMVKTKQYVLSDRPKNRTLVGKVMRIVVARRAARWYASIMVERERPDPLPVRGPITGVDFGINHRVTTSDGEQFAISDSTERRLRQLAHLMRALDRKHKGARQGTKNRWKMRMRVAKLHKEIADRRGDQIHKLSHRLATTSSMIVVEGFNIANLVEKRRKKIRSFEKRRTRRRIYEAAWGEIRRQLDYKTKWYGSRLVVTDPHAATDRTCHICGHVNPQVEQPTNDFHCEKCNAATTRQLNTALLQQQAQSA